jgi:sigma-B regulation protein RsbU (phosphoserine phosphatase)
MSMRATAPDLTEAAGPPDLPEPVGELLDAFRRARGVDVRVWARDGEEWSCLYPAGEVSPASLAPASGVVPIPGDPPLWIELSGDGAHADDAGFLAAVVARLIRQDDEARDFGREIADRYEEITLLYSISEILGSVISLEQAAGTILREVASVLGVQRVTLWIHDAARERLELIASVGGDGQQGPIAVDNDASVTAAVFRSRRPIILEPDEEYPRGDGTSAPASRGGFLSVPVSSTPPDGATRTIGVINLAGRESGDGFSAGDQKLISAIASQIGAAVENSRLVAASLRQERMVREMELAHDLQLKLLPSLEQFAGYAEVAARCQPAESVGGDFYQLFRLPGHRLGVMIGDVSSHGFGAAIILALTMSAAAIHASEGDSPGQVLRRAHRALIDELETTEMYLTLFYGVIDPAAGSLTYSNAGHSHAFLVRERGAAHRLSATNPPFGIVDLDDYGEETVPWSAERDLLFLFTDGLSDSLGMGEVAGVRRLVTEVVAGRDLPADRILELLFSLPRPQSPNPSDDRTAVLLRI